MDEAKYQVQLEAQIEVLQRWLEKAQPSNRPGYRQAVERKQLLERELELSRERQSREKTEITAKTADESTLVEKPSRWYESHPDVLRRRQIVLKNPQLSAESLCKVFDANSIPLPTGWEEEFHVTTRVEAYKIKKARARIDRIISTDRTQK